MKYRHVILLKMISEATKMSDVGLLYWVPSAHGNWSSLTKETTYVGGGGDAGILRKFERDGLTKNAVSPINPYACRITDKGREILDAELRSGRYLL